MSSSSSSQPLPKPNGDKRTLTRRFEIAVTSKKTKSYADGDPNRPWYRFQLALIPKHLAHLVDRVQLKLDPSYDVHVRTVTDPFVFSEKAWGQYPIEITVFPKQEFNHPPIHVPHLDLVLTKSRYTEARVLAFRNLPDDIKKKYFSTTTKGGPSSTDSSSQGQPPSNNSSSSDLSTTASTSVESTSPRHLSPPPVPAGSTTGQAKNGRKVIAGGNGGRERKVSSSSSSSSARPPVSAAASRALVSQRGVGTAAKSATIIARPPAPPKRKAADLPLPLPASPSASDPSRPTKRMKLAAASSSQSSTAGGVAAMLGLSTNPPAAAGKRPTGSAAAAAAGARKPTPASAAPSSSSLVSSILPTHKIPDDRIPRITNPHSAAHALVRSPPPTSFHFPSRPMPPSSPPPPMALPAAVPTTTDGETAARGSGGGGITVRRVEISHAPMAATGPVYSGAKLRSPPPAPPAPTSGLTSVHATPSRAVSNPSLQLPAKPTFAPLPPPPPTSSLSASSSTAATTPVLGNHRVHAHVTPTRPPAGVGGGGGGGGFAGAVSSPPKPDPDHRERLKHVLARISPAACVELAKYLYARNMATQRAEGDAQALGKVVYDKVGNALVLDVWRVPAEVVREVWVFVREKGLVAGCV